MAEFSEEEIRAVIKTLEKNEQSLSDGFMFYTGNPVLWEKDEQEKVYQKKMRQIAISILRAAKKAKKP